MQSSFHFKIIFSQFYNLVRDIGQFVDIDKFLLSQTHSNKIEHFSTEMKRIHEISSKNSKRGAKINSGSIQSANSEISLKNWPSSIFQEQCSE
jgi:hypothetical protein